MPAELDGYKHKYTWIQFLSLLNSSVVTAATTTMRITFVNLPAILLELAVGAAALPNVID